MYRICLRRYGGQGRLIHERSQKTKHFLRDGTPACRNNSTSSNGRPSTSLKYAFGSLAAASTAILGVFGYAGLNKDFRETLAGQHEYIKSALDVLYGTPNGEKRSSVFDQHADDVVVITTMDHQPGISAVDLDISNMEEKRRRARKQESKDDSKGDGGGGDAPLVLSTPEETPTDVINENDNVEASIKDVEDTQVVEFSSGTGGEQLEDSAEVAPEPSLSKAEEPAGDVSAAEVESVQVLEQEESTTAEVVLPDDVKLKESLMTEESSQEAVLQVDDTVAAPLERETELKQEPDAVALAEAELDARESEKSTIETLLQVHMDKLVAEGQEVVNAQKRAAGTIYTYVNQLGHALAVPQDDPAIYDTWKLTSDLESESQGAIDQAKGKEVDLQQKIAAVRGMISALRKFGDSEVANRAQALSSSISLKVQRTAEDIKKASNDLVSMAEYHSLAAKAKQEFEKELGQLPEESRTERDAAKTGLDGINPLLVYALKKVEFLSRALETRTQEEQERVVAALEKQRQEEEKRFEDILASEVKRVKEEDTLENQKKEMELITQYEGEMRTQLKRQASAHREHLADVLNLQAAELNESHNQILESRLGEEHKKYEDELERKVACLKGVDEAVSVVVDFEEENRKARELWLAVQALFSAFQEPLLNGISRALMPEIVALKCSAGDNDVVQQVVSTIPPSAAANGVLTEAELSRRFRKVKNVSRKVAMVDEGGSLVTYVFSYLRSLFVIDMPKARAVDEDIDVDEISTYEILAKAEKCVKSGDFEQAVKFMNLLRGVSRCVAQDWLDEAKAHLETKLALDFLLAFARAKGVGTTV